MNVTGRKSWFQLILFAIKGSSLSRTWPRLLAVLVVSTAVTAANRLLGIFQSSRMQR